MMSSTELKRAIRQIRADMRLMNIRVVSCFNAGLTDSERRYNSRLFELKTWLDRAAKS
jgi:hypothetical protein